jgi:quinolinate synthase
MNELQSLILAEKKRRGFVILAHTYQRPEVLAVADLTGDSFALSKAAAGLAAERVLLCGVRFMAETVKILSPQKQVVLSHPGAGCPMAEQIEPARVEEYRRRHPDHAVCAYINTTTELKALADVCVTSSSAVHIVKQLPQQDVLFLPDQNLGAYVRAQVPEKTIHLLDGFCHVHHCIRPEHVQAAAKRHPGAKVAVHPECPADVAALGDMVGSTKEIIDYALSREDDIIFVTERGVCDALRLQYPGRGFYQLEPELMTCDNMKKTTLQGVYDALTGRGGEEIVLDEDVRRRALGSIEMMLHYGG